MYIEFPRGDQKPLTFKLKNKKGEYLTNGDVNEITVTCRLEPYEKSPILFQKKLTDETIAYDAEAGNFVVKMLEIDTKKLDYKDYGFDIEIRAGDLIDTKVGVIKITHEYS